MDINFFILIYDLKTKPRFTLKVSH